MQAKQRTTPLEEWISFKIGKQGQSFTLQELEAYQLEQLNATLKMARENSIFYGKSLEQIGKLGCLEELTELPFTTEEDLRQAPGKLLCVSQSEIARVVTLASSGTTGIPKRTYFTAADQELTVDFFQQGMSTLVEPGERVLILLPGASAGSVGNLLAKGLQRLGAEAVPYGLISNLRSALKKMEEEKITSLVGIPVQVLALARYAQSKQQAVQLKSVLLSTDHVPRIVKKTIGDLWQCEVYEHYGMTEMGLGGGVDCSAHEGYHLREADLYFEIIDPSTGCPVSKGELGEVVFTTLTRKGMPLVRYRTGDLASFETAPCSCGSILKRMTPIQRRVGGRIALGESSIDMAALDEVLFALPYLVDFEVEVIFAPEKNILALHCSVLTEEFTHGEIYAQLRKIKALAEAEAQGQVSFSLTSSYLKGWLADYQGKRKIVVSRK